MKHLCPTRKKKAVKKISLRTRTSKFQFCHYFFAGDDTVTDQPYRYLTVDEMKSLGDDSLPIDVTRDERIDSNRMVQSTETVSKPPTALEDAISPQHASMIGVGKTVVDSNYIIDNVKIDKTQQHVG